MNGKFKYVVIFENGMEQAIVFSKAILHNHAVNLREVKPISAGFCDIEDGVVTVHGHSTSLNLSPRREDADVILTTLLLNGVTGLVCKGAADLQSADFNNLNPADCKSAALCR
jgi:hypothetical protein